MSDAESMSTAEGRRIVRMLKFIGRWRENTSLMQQLADLAREAEEPLPSARVAGATALGDPEKMAGVPISAHGVSTAWARPEWFGT